MDIRSFFQKNESKKQPSATRKSTKAAVKDSSIAPMKKDSSPRKPKRKAAEVINVESSSDDASGSEVISIKKSRKRIKQSNTNIEMENSNATPQSEDDKIDFKKHCRAPPAPFSGCLNGKTFLFTGMFHNLSRDDAVHLVKQCGGNVAKSISTKLNYLVAGHVLENGDNVAQSSKYKDSMSKNIRILNQNEFYNLISEASSAKEIEYKRVEQAAKSSNNIAKNKKSNSTDKSSESSNELWTDKYKPTQMQHMIGNIALGEKLKRWLVDWNAVNVSHTKKAFFSTKLSENMAAKTVLLSGPPGIGKSTIAGLVAKECGFEITEFNASDTRSKKMLQSNLKEVLGTQALHFGNMTSSSRDSLQLSRRVVVMDEVDGMSSGDRGGIQELIQLIKTSKTPIICICNDRQSQKVRSLANYSLDLRMRRPTKQQISKRLMEIGMLEGLDMEKNAIEEAADRCGNDIRQLLTQMQRWRLTSNKLSYNDLVHPKSKIFHEKDSVLRLNTFSATQQIFQENLSLDERTEAYFVDYDFMPLMVQENYMQSIMNSRVQSDEKLQAACIAADFIAESDIISRYVRQDQRWDLLTKQAAMNVAACVYAKGFIGHPEFSKWLGKNSSASKSKRLLSELSMRMRSHASGSTEVIRLDYIPFMKEMLLHRLLGGEQNIVQVIELLDACEISREDLIENMESFKLPGIKRHSYTELDTKAKTGFTRQYNKGVHKSQAVVQSTLSTTAGKKMKVSAIDTIGVPSDAESEEEIENEDDISNFQKKTLKGASKSGAASKRKATQAKGGRNSGSKTKSNRAK